MSDPAPRRGEVRLARLDKVRPAVALTRDPIGSLLHAVIGASVTSTIRAASTEVHVGLDNGVRALTGAASLAHLRAERSLSTRLGLATTAEAQRTARRR